MVLKSDPKRTWLLTEALLSWYNGPHDGLLENAELPESEPPADVSRGSYEHVMFLTLTVSIDYQRSAQQLWDAARLTWQDESVRWVFFPKLIRQHTDSELVRTLQKHKLSKKPSKDALIWKTVALSFLELFDGDPRVLFEKFDYDALQIYRAMRKDYSKHFPYLAGATGTSKILSLWIRMLKDEASIDFKNIHEHR